MSTFPSIVVVEDLCEGWGALQTDSFAKRGLNATFFDGIKAPQTTWLLNNEDDKLVLQHT